MKFTPDRIALLRKEFEQLSSWDEWGAFLEKFFNWENVPERTVEQIENDLQRQIIELDGHVWEPFAANYDIEPEVEILFDDLSDKIFAKLEPEAHKSNTKHPELFGWKCVARRRFTRNKTTKCAFCGQQLLQLPLNE